MYYDDEEVQYYKEYKNECIKYKNNIGSDNMWKSFESNINLGDKIYIEYLPMSQKYIFTHTPECGIVVEINENKEIFILNHKNQVTNIEKGYLGLYSKAYDMIIYKYIG